MSMHNPAHPGEILKELVIEPLELCIAELADRLGISQKNLSNIVNCHSPITPEIALRLEMTFGNPEALHWLRLQNAYDLWNIKKHYGDIKVTEIELQTAC